MNLTFTMIFLAEMVIKLVGYGFVGYIRDLMNVFDGLIVILSLVEIIFF